MTSIHYTGRTDFRAFDVLLEAIDRATKKDLQNAVKTCKEMSEVTHYHEGCDKAILWKDMATLLRKQIRRF